MRLTDEERMYAEWILGNWETDEKPAVLDGNEIAFVGDDGRKEFLWAVQAEAIRDAIEGVRTPGKQLARKIEESGADA